MSRKPFPGPSPGHPFPYVMTSRSGPLGIAIPPADAAAGLRIEGKGLMDWLAGEFLSSASGTEASGSRAMRCRLMVHPVRATMLMRGKRIVGGRNPFRVRSGMLDSPPTPPTRQFMTLANPVYFDEPCIARGGN